MICGFCGKPVKEYELARTTKCIMCNDDICGKCSDAGSMYCSKHTQKQKVDELTDYNCSHSGCGATIIPPERYCSFHKKFAELPASAKIAPKPHVSYSSSYSSINSEPLTKPKYYNYVEDEEYDEFPTPRRRMFDEPMIRSSREVSWGQNWMQPKLSLEQIRNKNEDYVLRLQKLMDNIPEGLKKYVEEEIKKTREATYEISKYQQDYFMTKAQNSMLDYLEAEEHTTAKKEEVPEPDNIIQSVNVEELEKTADAILSEQQKRDNDRNLMDEIVKKLRPEQTKIISQLDNIANKLAAQASTQTRLIQSIESVYSRLAVIEQVLCVKQPVKYAQNYTEQGAVMSIHALTDRLANLEASMTVCKSLLQEIVKNTVSDAI